MSWRSLGLVLMVDSFIVLSKCECESGHSFVGILNHDVRRYLLQNMDWLDEELGDYDSDYIIIDCPGA